MSGANRAGLPRGEVAAAWAGTRRVRAGRWDVRYREAGSGPAVVLAHGLGLNADYWFRNAPPIAAAGYRVLAPDLPGFGRTRGPADGLSVPEQMTALLEWADALELEGATYVGHSLSCQVALELAAHAPSRVQALVLAAPTGDPKRLRLLRQALGLLVDIPRESVRLAIAVAFSYLQAGLIRTGRTWWKGARESPLPLLPRVRAPALVVVGTRDPVVRPEFAQALADALPAGRLAWIPGAAHAVVFTHADDFNHAVLDFLGERGIGGGDGRAGTG